MDFQNDDDDDDDDVDGDDVDGDDVDDDEDDDDDDEDVDDDEDDDDDDDFKNLPQTYIYTHKYILITQVDTHVHKYIETHTLLIKITHIRTCNL